MKQYEELTRMRVEEAIQIGLRSQSVRRAQNEKNLQAPPTSPEKLGQRGFSQPTQPNWLSMLVYRLVRLGG
jgi:hypothetical protein